MNFRDIINQQQWDDVVHKCEAMQSVCARKGNLPELWSAMEGLLSAFVQLTNSHIAVNQMECEMHGDHLRKSFRELEGTASRMMTATEQKPKPWFGTMKRLLTTGEPEKEAPGE